MPMRGICTTISTAYWTTGKKVHASKERLRGRPHSLLNMRNLQYVIKRRQLCDECRCMHILRRALQKQRAFFLTDYAVSLYCMQSCEQAIACFRGSIAPGGGA